MKGRRYWANADPSEMEVLNLDDERTGANRDGHDNRAYWKAR